MMTAEDLREEIAQLAALLASETSPAAAAADLRQMADDLAALQSVPN